MCRQRHDSDTLDHFEVECPETKRTPIDEREENPFSSTDELDGEHFDRNTIYVHIWMGGCVHRAVVVGQ